MSRPFTVTEPEDGVSKPPRHMSSDDFPEPECPTTAVSPPPYSSISQPRRISVVVGPVPTIRRRSVALSIVFKAFTFVVRQDEVTQTGARSHASAV